MARSKAVLDVNKTISANGISDARFALDIGEFKDGIAYVTVLGTTGTPGTPTINFVSAVNQDDMDTKWVNVATATNLPSIGTSAAIAISNGAEWLRYAIASLGANATVTINVVVYMNSCCG